MTHGRYARLFACGLLFASLCAGALGPSGASAQALPTSTKANAQPTVGPAHTLPHAADAVSLSILCTTHGQWPEGFAVAGGHWGRSVRLHHSAFLVRRGREHVLFDTGLGSQIAEQVRDLPTVTRWLLRYREPVVTAQAQLQAAGISVPHIVITHPHWDHLGGAGDFPGAQVWVGAADLAQFDQAKAGQVRHILPSQARAAVNWRAMAWREQPFEGFAQSLDWWGDGRLVLVPMPGHTRGSLGAFITTASGRRYLLVGDALWRSDAAAHARPKSWLGRRMADEDEALAQRTVRLIQAAVQRDPQLTVLASHDGEQQLRLGLFPAWLK